MNRTFYTFLIIFIAFSSRVFAGDTGGYLLKFKIKNMKAGASCLLANYYGGNQYKQDSAVTNDKGELVFKGTEKYPQGVYLIILPSKKYFDFIMDAGQNFSMETDTTDFVKDMVVKNSAENKFFYDYQNFMSSKQKQVEPLQSAYKRVKDSNKDSLKMVQDKLTAIDKEVKDYKINFIKNNPKTFVSQLFLAMEEPEIPQAPMLANGKKDTTFAYHYYKTHFFDHVDFSDERLLRTPIFHKKINDYMDKLTPQTPDSIDISVDYIIEKSRANPEMFKYIVSALTFKYEDSKIMGMYGVFVHLVEKYYATKQVNWVDSAQMYKIVDKGTWLKYTIIGAQAPQLTMNDTSGNPVSLYDIKSKYTVVVFWEQACGHCKKEIPELMELYKTKLKAKGVQVYAIESEEKLPEWKKFVKEHDLNWINVWEKDDYKRALAKKLYFVETTPTLVLLDENKIVRARKIDPSQIEGIIDYLEKQKN